MESIRGSTVLGVNRKHRLRVVEEVRFCAESECTTKLSKYNQHAELCFSHTPKKRLRVRGTTLTD